MQALQLIRRKAAEAPVVVFMKGTPQRPMSAGSKKMIDVLEQCQATYLWVDVQRDPNIRAFLPKFSASRDCPQLFMQGELIGGIAVVDELHQQGELKPMLDNCRGLAEAS